MRHHSSLKRNLWSLAGLYGVCLLAALGCPGPHDSGTAQPTAVAAEPPSAPPGARTARAANTAAAAGYGAGKFDPVKVNGKFFVGWKKPDLALVITGRQDGYLEPCGCAGLENQKGGLGRRHALLEQLSGQGWPLAAVDVGGVVRRFGRQAEIEMAVSAEAFKKMGYSAVALGTAELRLSAGEVAAAVAGAEPDQCLFVSANVSLLGLTPRVRVVNAGGRRLGITAVLGATYQKQVNNAEIELTPPDQALADVLPQLKDCDLRILLAHATLAEAQKLAQQFPQFDVVVVADGADEPPAEAAPLPGGRGQLIEVGHKGMFAVVLGFYDGQAPGIRYQRVALDARYQTTAEMHDLMVDYQSQLRELGWDGLGLKQTPHPRATAADPLSGQFAGAQSCRKCHPTAYGIWSKSKHAHATETLTKLDPARQFDPQCISCHATGWNPQEYAPYAGGFSSLEATPHLQGNQCENCHGPAAAHVAAEEGKNRFKREPFRQALRLQAIAAKDQVCIRCHDLDNSPRFHADPATSPDAGFDAFWRKVEHKGKQ